MEKPPLGGLGEVGTALAPVTAGGTSSALKGSQENGMLQNKRVIRFLVATGLALGLAARSQAATDDTALFSTVVPPNVMLLVDNSGSMDNIVWHPAFDPNATPSCQVYVDAWTYVVGSSPVSFSVNSPGCVNSAREVFPDPALAAIGHYTRWSGRYLNWYFSSAADVVPPGGGPTPAQEIPAKNNGTFSPCIGGGSFDLYRRSRITAVKNIVRDLICQVNAAGAVRFGLAQFRQGNDPDGGYVVVPANDYLDASGNPNVYTLNGVTKSHGQHLNDAIDQFSGEAWTPLGESLFQVYTYFMSRKDSDRPVGQDGSTEFPKYEYLPSHALNGAFSSAGAPTVPDSPVQYACQRNFVIVLTDGEPTRDNFDTSGNNTDKGFNKFQQLIGNYDGDAENETPTTAPACVGGPGWKCGRYLDDIAKFMQDVDFRPDLPAHNGNQQVIDVYTVGFTTNATANQLLQDTADAANGQFYFSTNPGKLASDLVAAVSDIIQKSQSFTAATVPATRTASGGQFYTSLFVPSKSSGYWEGHLKAWKITAAGDIQDANGSCALNDPAAPASCSAGAFLSTAVPFWDAGVVLQATAPAARNLFTSRLTGSPGVSSIIRFDTGTLTAADLNLTTADLPSYDTTPIPAPTTAAELKDVVVQNLRGCQLGDVSGTCVQRSWKLGDIFHSDPVVVSGPSSFLQDGDFQAFEAAFQHRDRVIVAGANDGFLRFFDAGSWQAAATPPDYDTGTGAERAGFMPYGTRQVAKEIPIDTGGRTTYGVDGSPSVADVWLYRTATTNAPRNGTDWDRWRTLAVGGLRQGGNHYWALDVTDPSAGSCKAPASGSGYPCYLWEFPREDATPGSTVSWMGETWSQPVITRIRVNPTVANPVLGTPSYDRWVAIFGTGYDPKSDPNEDATYDPQAKAGRAIVVLDLKTGKVIAEKKFDPSTTTPLTDPSTFVYDPANPERSMHYAFTASPGVFDLDFDGYADVIYIPDLGGNLWKWVIHGIGQDPVNGVGSTAQPNWPFRKVFQAPVYAGSSPAKNYYKSFFFSPSATLKSGNLWLALGSGERMNLTFPGIAGTTAENNRFYVLRDRDPLDKNNPTQIVGEPDLRNLTNLAACSDITNFDGYFFIAQEGEKFVTRTDIFSFVTLAASYIPTVSSDPCVSSGSAKLYAFKIYCGQGLFVDPAGGGTPSVSVDIGAGMPTSPQVTISSNGGYSGSGQPNPNKVIINNQDGEVVVPGAGDMNGDGIPDCPGASCPCPNWPNDCPLPPPGTGSGQFYWREL